jgi:hypothetical protein
VADQIIVAWMRQERLTGDVHLLNGYYDIKAKEDLDRKPFADRTYAKMIGEFARHARDNPEAQLYVLRLDQKPQPVAMRIEPGMADLLREDPVRYIEATSPPARTVKLKLDDSVKLNKVQDNLHVETNGEAWHTPIPGGYDTVVESFGDDIYCRVSGNLIECPSCGRWAASTPTEDVDADMECSSCLFRDLFTITVTPKSTWAVIPTESLLQNTTTNGKRFYIPRAWNKGGPWIKTEQLRQKYESFCKERNDASDCQ